MRKIHTHGHHGVGKHIWLRRGLLNTRLSRGDRGWGVTPPDWHSALEGVDRGEGRVDRKDGRGEGRIVERRWGPNMQGHRRKDLMQIGLRHEHHIRENRSVWGFCRFNIFLVSFIAVISFEIGLCWRCLALGFF